MENNINTFIKKFNDLNDMSNEVSSIIDILNSLKNDFSFEKTLRNSSYILNYLITSSFDLKNQIEKIKDNDEELNELFLKINHLNFFFNDLENDLFIILKTQFSNPKNSFSLSDFPSDFENKFKIFLNGGKDNETKTNI